ncbi:MAG: insulinase family protein, partial [Lentisphaeraceae bacterium]|nr:insulinase family protein [Lentisphaeraceae bacterium]
MKIFSTLLILFFLTSSSLLGQASKKLPVDPTLYQNTLPNGLRYIIKENKTPPGKVEMYLHVGSGSIDEEDNQQGLAHFLEHMAFNGSKNFPAGKLIKYFESMGLTFGMHQNAFTSFDQTTYILSLPNTKEETLDKGLLCLSDFAFRLDLDTSEIDKERGVIQEEDRARTSVRQRILNKMLPVLLPGSRAAERLPIGKMDVIQNAPRERFVEFYEKWYHPDNSVLMIVGDVNTEAIEKTLIKHFQAWPRKEKIPEHLPSGIKPYTKTSAFVVTDSELTDASVGLTSIRSLRKIENEADYKDELVSNLGEWIMNKRFSDMLKAGKASYQSASSGSSSFLNVCRYISASANGEPEKWKEMLEQLIAEIKRARTFGFHQQEMDDAIKTFISMADRAEKTESTKPSNAII